MENDAEDGPGTAPKPTRRRRGTARLAGQDLVCGWCAGSILVRRRGRPPKWCSDTCRLSAWRARTTAASDRVDVKVVDREVEIEVRVPVKVVERVEVPVHPRGSEWQTALFELATQLDSGVFPDRDITALMTGLERVTVSLRRRPAFRRYYRINWPLRP